ncbi:glycerol kinase [Pelomyxa schiedti]|nr:glycerol kinase [Pelomyxa schiedti]
MASEGARKFVIGLDQGTSSTRAIAFSLDTLRPRFTHTVTLDTIYPHDGWVEQDAVTMLESARVCLDEVSAQIEAVGGTVAAVGVANQRETTIVWDRTTGVPFYNAIVWRDSRTSSIVASLTSPPNSANSLREKCGLPISTYFSAVKMKWLMENVPSVGQACLDGRCSFGTVDTWLIWNLTGGTNSGAYVTDVTNASRTMLMNINTLRWDPQLCLFFSVPVNALPAIRSSAEVYGRICSGKLRGIPICGNLGDQQSALLGQGCVKHGMAKNTYGTGCFMLLNTGKLVQSTHGLLSTVAYQLGPSAPVVYALEGSVAVAGRAVQWFRDNMKAIKTSAEINILAASVPDSNGLYFVPAFTGLYAPRWCSSARGLAIGINETTNVGHFARAIFEATCFQTKEVLDAMVSDSSVELQVLRVDGGMVVADIMLQIQADLLGIPIMRPLCLETTALGAAVAAGIGCGLIDVDALPSLLQQDSTTFSPTITVEQRALRMSGWTKAVERSLNWAS